MALNERIIGAESSGNRYARNSRSTAYGPHQFLAGTWLELVKRYRPDLMQGRSRDELLALRSDEKLSSEMSGNFNAENAAYLTQRGLPADDASLYLAHFAGPAGAAKVLANPDKPASELLGADALAANPFLKDWSGADVAGWAGRKMGWKPVAMPTSASEDLSPNPIATPQPTAPAAPQGDKPVIPFLTELFASMGGAGAAGAGAAGGGGLGSLFGGANGGLLGSLFGGGEGGAPSFGAMMNSGGQPEPTNPLAGAAAPAMGGMMRPQVDMSGLRAMIANRPQLSPLKLMR